MRRANLRTITFAVLAAAAVGLGARQGSAGSGSASSQGPPPQSTVPQTGTAAVSGAVTNAVSGHALAGAIVSLTLRNGSSQARAVRQVTDVQGRFVFRDLVAANGYSITVTRTGFADGAYGQVTMFGASTTFALTDAQWLNDASVLMWKPGAISGRVLDERGEPLVGAYARAMARVMIAGELKIVGGPVARTDDRGEYRISGLPPGRYVICVPSVQNAVPSDSTPDMFGPASQTAQSALRSLTFGASIQPPPRADALLDAADGSGRLLLGNYATAPLLSNGHPQAYPITFYPGVSSPIGATAIDLALSEERRGLDVVMRPVPTVKVSGAIDGAIGDARGLTLRLIPTGLEELGPGSEAATTMVGADGAFTFLNVPAGAYTIDARRNSSELTFPAGTTTMSLPSAPIAGSRGSGSSSGSIVAGPPGAGILNRSGAGADSYWARTAVTVGTSDVSSIGVTLHPCVTISGRFVFEGTTRVSITPSVMSAGVGRATPGTIRSEQTPIPPMPNLNAEPANGDPTLGVLHSDHDTDADAAQTFLIEGVKSGAYVFRVSGPTTAPWAVKSIAVGNDDYTNRAIDTSRGRDITDVVITFTDKVAAMSGVVEDDHGLAPAAAVILFPSEREQWSDYGFTPVRVRSAIALGANGYSFSNVPAGSYYAVAVDASQATAWQDPAFLAKAAAQLSPVVVGWGDVRMLNLKVMRIK